LAFIFLLFPAIALTQTKYHLLKTIPLAGDGSWDFLKVDSQARRLYISHDTKVTVLDVDTDQVVGEITGLDSVHGIAIARNLNRGYITNGRRSTVTCFDLNSLRVIAEIQTGKGPDAIAYDEGTGRVFAFNGKDHSATVIDASTNQVIGTVPLDAKPESAVTDGQGSLYVNLEDRNQVAQIDTQKLAVLNHWSVTPGESPSGLAMDPQSHRLFVGCANQMLVILDSQNGKTIAHFPIGAHVDDVAFDAETGLIFSSNGDGTLTIIHEKSPSEFAETQTVETQLGARTMGLDKKTHNIYLATAQFGPMNTAPNAHPRRPILPGTFVLLKVGP